MLSALLDLWGDPPGTSQQTIEQTVKLPLVWDAITLMQLTLNIVVMWQMIKAKG